jgi:hypothetical protein
MSTASAITSPKVCEYSNALLLAGALGKSLTINFHPLPGLPAELAFAPPEVRTCLRDDDSSDTEDNDSSDASDMHDHYDSDWDVYGEEDDEETGEDWEEYLLDFWNSLRL